jgi:hypothetical protein
MRVAFDDPSADASAADAAAAREPVREGAPAAPPSAPAPAPTVTPTTTTGAFDLADDFADLVADVASAIATSVPGWRVQIGEAAARWQAEGIATGVLERALRLTQAPDVDGLLGAFSAAVARLRALEREASAIDPSIAGQSVFRDPARAVEAQALVDRLRRERPARPPIRVDAESWVAEWPDVIGLMVES